MDPSSDIKDLKLPSFSPLSASQPAISQCRSSAPEDAAHDRTEPENGNWQDTVTVGLGEVKQQGAGGQEARVLLNSMAH